ncbi:MAG: polyribonucleotide nucleotidyltransferase [Thermoplasmatota archaeon]
MTIKTFETDFAGKKLIIEYGRMAHQAGAAVTARMGDTVVLASATMSRSGREGMDFFPLMVDYEERYYAKGLIKGPRYMKREGRPSSEAVLIGRMIDRGLRPLFPDGLRNEVQVICLPLSLDEENRPDVVAMLGACAALHISNIPFNGPIAGCRIGMVTGDMIINPTVEELEYSELQLTLMGDGERVTMVECEARELDDETTIEAFRVGMEALGPIAKFFDDIRKEIGIEKTPADQLQFRGGLTEEDEDVIKKMKAALKPSLKKYLFDKPIGTKGERFRTLEELEDKVVDKLKKKLTTKDRDEEATENYLRGLLDHFFHEYIEEEVTLSILDSDLRVDGRKLDEIRPLSAEVGVIPRTHGSGLFARGETQILTIVTLGSPRDDLSIETMENEGSKKYFHHYNFLPYCVGEVKPLRGAGRREIGHGALAEKALKPVLPSTADFPYTTRVVSEVMGSNGSSSMASTCGSTLALMDAGIPISSPVAGIAMGLASDGKRWKVLTDLQDLEDGPGGMDFKFTSTRNGITAVQMDTKTRGLSKEMIEATFPQMRKAINEILDVMEKAIPEPRSELSPYAPRMIHMMIDPEKIGEVIGPGGKVIRGMCDELGVDIDVSDDGTVLITSVDAEAAHQAEERIRGIVKVVEVGEVYEDVEVVKIMPYGAFVRLTPSTDAMLHVSELKWERVEKVTDVVNLGDRLTVKVIEIERGKVDVSLKALTPMPEGYRRDRQSRGPPRRPQGKGGSRNQSRRKPQRR